MADENVFYPLRAGLYKPYDDDNVVFLDPAEVLRDKGLPDTEEMRLGLYEGFKSQFADEDIEVVLIAREDGVSMQDYIQSQLNQRGNSHGEETTNEQENGIGESESGDRGSD